MSYSYDAANNPTQVKMPTGAVSSAVYSTGGACGSTDAANADLPKCITDDAGNSKAMTYDAMGNLLSSADTTGGSTTGSKITYTYQRPASATSGPDCGGKAGQRCSAKDGNGNLTSYGYDGDGNLTSLTPPSPLGKRTFEYDSLGRLIAASNGRGQRLTYSYDAQDRLLQTDVPASDGASSQTMMKDYDQDGNLNFNDAVISYDAQNRQDSVKDEQSDSEYSVGYDEVGNVIGVDGPGGYSARYEHNAANQNTLAGWASAGCTADTTPQVGCVKFVYDNNGAETRRFLPTATVLTTTRDASGRPTRMAVVSGRTTLYDHSYSYQKPGTTGTIGDRRNIQSTTFTTGVSGSIINGSTTTYGYDSMSRLTSAVEVRSTGAENARWTYAYDKANNRTSQARSGSTQSETGTIGYGYNAANELASIGGDTTNLGYDADGNETAAAGDDWVNVPHRDSTTTPYGDVTGITTHTSDGADNVLAYGYGGVNPGQYLLTWEHGTSIKHSPLGEALLTDDGGNATQILRGPNGKALAYRVDDQNAYLVPDRQGSTIGVLDDAAAKVASYGYDPYGNIRSAPGQDIRLAWSNTITYTGARRDLQTGLYRLGVRWYDPNTGRFTTPDPTAQESNAYTYAAGNPCNRADPSGGYGIHDCGTDIAASTVGGALAGGVAGFLGGPFSELTVPVGAFTGGILGGVGGTGECAVKALMQ